jgi:hypothetical protein
MALLRKRSWPLFFLTTLRFVMLVPQVAASGVPLNGLSAQFQEKLFIPMKIVKCKIVVATAEDYLRVIEKLCHIHVSHSAAFNSPNEFLITCMINHVMAERNLDMVMEELRIHVQKEHVMKPGSLPVQQMPHDREAA